MNKCEMISIEKNNKSIQHLEYNFENHLLIE